jgi:hypothetical protein
MVPGMPGTGTASRQRKQQGREGEEKGREGREEGKERGREGAGVRRGKERACGGRGWDGIGSKRREQEIEWREGGRAVEQSKSEEGMQRKSRMDSSGCSFFY